MSILSDDEFEQECDYCGKTWDCKCKPEDCAAPMPREYRKAENTGWEVYLLFNALKLHFTSDKYDYFKYQGKTNVSKDSFLNSKHKYFFYRISRKYSVEEIKWFFIANLVAKDNNIWIGDYLTEEAEANYKNWQKRNQALTYTFGNELDYLLSKWTPVELLKVPVHSFPPLLTSVMNNDICIETIAILNELMDFLPMWERKIEDDIVAPQWYRRIRKLTPFLEYDRMKFRDIVKTKVRSND